MRLGVDLDGVLADMIATTLRVLNEAFGRSLKPEDVNAYDLAVVYGVKREEIRRVFEGQETLFLDMSPLPGAQEGLNRLYREHEVFIITARYPQQAELTAAWLARWGFKYHHLLLVGTPDKREASRQTEVDLFIEDRLQTVLDLNATGLPVILMDAAYNQGPLPPGVHRCRTWPEVLEVIENHPLGAGNLPATLEEASS